jgi:hypothetical protein
VSPVKYELGFYIPEDDILHSHCRENLKSYNSKEKSENSKHAKHTMNVLRVLVY